MGAHEHHKERPQPPSVEPLVRPRAIFDVLTLSREEHIRAFGHTQSADTSSTVLGVCSSFPAMRPSLEHSCTAS